MSDKDTAPLTLLGSSISYFTGKMENYLRLKQIPHRLESTQSPAVRQVLERELGVKQMPVIILPDGRYMTDSSKIREVFNIGRFCRIADGPDEVHLSHLGKLTDRELTP